MIQQEEYKRGYVNGEGHTFNAANPDEAGFLSRAKYAYGAYCNGNMSIGFGGTNANDVKYQTLRDYYFSRQDRNKYLDQIDPLTKDGDGKGYRKMNINRELPRPLSKPLNILESTLTGLLMEVGTQANDASARHEKDQLIGNLKHLANPQTQKFVAETGMKIPEMDQVKGFSGPEDIDFLNSVGGIRMATEIMMKDGIDVTVHESKWKAMSPLFARDIIALNALCCNIYTDASTKRAMVEYIDPARAFSDPSIYEDHRDAGTMGFIRTSRISEIRQRIGGMSDPMEKKLRDAARSFNNRYGNRTTTQYARVSYGQNTDIDDVLVDVMTLYFVDTEPTRWAERRHGNMGNKTFQQVSIGTKVKGANSESHDVSIHKLYKVNWVIGSDIIFDYGEAEDMVREGENGSKRIVHNMYLYVGHAPSIVEQCVGHVDDICLNTYKMRQAVKSLPPSPRLALDLNGLETGFKMDGKQYDITSELKNFAIDGTFVYKSKGEYHMPGVDGQQHRSPLQPVEISVIEDIMMFHSRIQQELSNIQYIAGFNPTTSGDPVAPDMLKHVAEAAIRSTNAANAPLVDVWKNAYERMCQIVAHKWQLAVIHGDITYDNLPTSSGVMKVVKLTKELAFHDWNIFIKVDTTATRDLMIQDLQSKRDFIDPEVYYIILQSLMQNDLTKAQVLLSRQVNRSKQEEHQRMMEIQQAQASGNQQAAVAAEEARRVTLMEEARQKLAEIKAQMEADLVILREKAKLGLSMSERQ